MVVFRLWNDGFSSSAVRLVDVQRMVLVGIADAQVVWFRCSEVGCGAEDGIGEWMVLQVQ